MSQFADPQQTPERQIALASPIYADLDAETQAEALHRHVALVLAARIEALARIDRDAVIEVLSYALIDLGQGSPDVSLHAEMARRDAELWARLATPDEIEAYGMACLRHIPKRLISAPILRRVLVNVWRRIDQSDRRRFLDRVAADGSFRAGS